MLRAVERAIVAVQVFGAVAVLAVALLAAVTPPPPIPDATYNTKA